METFYLVTPSDVLNELLIRNRSKDSQIKYWERKVAKLEESNLQALRDLQQANELTEVYRSHHQKAMEALVSLALKKCENEQMLMEMKAFYDKHQSVFK